LLPLEVWAALQGKALAALKKYLSVNPHQSSMPAADLRSQLEREADGPSIRALIEALAERGTLVRVDSGLALPGHKASLRPKEQESADRIETIYRNGRFEPPLEDEVLRQTRLPLNEFRRILGTLLKEGYLVRLDARIIYHREALERVKAALVDFLRLHGKITIADAKDVLRVSRKFACAVIEYLDKIQLTRRQGDVHVLKRGREGSDCSGA
jgi:selenocysteine-specific elongation factor